MAKDGEYLSVFVSEKHCREMLEIEQIIKCEICGSLCFGSRNDPCCYCGKTLSKPPAPKRLEFEGRDMIAFPGASVASVTSDPHEAWLCLYDEIVYIKRFLVDRFGKWKDHNIE